MADSRPIASDPTHEPTVKLHHFELPFESYLLQGDECLSERNERNTILLHGAGASSRTTFTRLRRYLYGHGISSVSFDFVGHGETGGCIHETSLRKRTDQAAAVIKGRCQEPLTMIGASMGGYTALKLTQLFAVKNLVLLVPAVYTPQAYDISFGPQFSAVIRRTESWRNSDAFEIMRHFTGNVLIMAAELDTVIPRTLVEELYQSARKANSKALHIIPEASHLSLFPREKNFQDGMELMLELIGD